MFDFARDKNRTIEVVKTPDSDPFLEVPRSTCDQTTPDANELKINLYTAAHKHQLSFVIEEKALKFRDPKGEKHVLRASPETVDELRTHVRRLCTEDADLVEVTSFPSLAVNLVGIVSQNVPQCEIKIASKGLLCKQSYKTSSEYKAVLTKTNKRLLQRIKRPPYGLMRKLNISRQLADATSDPSKILSLCALTLTSFPGEIPIVMQTDTWQKDICILDEDELAEHPLVKEALALAVKEVKLLESLALKNSYRGIISLRIPKFKTDGEKDFFISLFPTEKVYENIEKMVEAKREEASQSEQKGTTKQNKSNNENKESQKLALDNPSKNQGAPVASPVVNAPASEFCWHPFASDGSEAGKSLYAAGLISPDQGCSISTTPYMLSVLDTLAGAITSDSSFVVTNFHGKILRLPKGEYNYQVSSLPKNVKKLGLNAGRIVQKGRIKWNGKKYTSIK